VDGDLIELRGGDTCQMPAAVSGAVVRVVSALNTLPTAPAIVSATATSSSFYGDGVNGVTSFTLAGVGSVTVTLISDGTVWFMFGQPNTGWLALTLPGSWGLSAGFFAPAYRVIGNQVGLRGSLQNNTGTNSTPVMTGLPAPASSICIPLGMNAAGQPYAVVTGGTWTGPFTASGIRLSMDGCGYSIN
jgi:hypothetical protein